MKFDRLRIADKVFTRKELVKKSAFELFELNLEMLHELQHAVLAKSNQGDVVIVVIGQKDEQEPRAGGSEVAEKLAGQETLNINKNEAGTLLYSVTYCLKKMTQLIPEDKEKLLDLQEKIKKFLDK